MTVNRGQFKISVAHSGGTLVPDMSGFCSTDTAQGSLSQKQEIAALLSLPRVLGWGFGAGGGFEFLLQIEHKPKSTYLLAKKISGTKYKNIRPIVVKW